MICESRAQISSEHLATSYLITHVTLQMSW